MGNRRGGNKQAVAAPRMVALAALLALIGLALLAVAVLRGGQPPSPPAADPVPAGRPPAASLGPVRHTAARHPPARHPPARHPPARHTPASAGKGIDDRVSGPTLPESLPVRVDIPRLGVSSPLVHLGVDGRGAMEVPTDPARAGWYDRGPTPGALGPAVIAGHVTWNRVPAVFYRLATMRPGDRVTVRRVDGSRAVFAVTGVSRFVKTRFPTAAVFGSTDHAALRLITCGGTYDESSHRYLDNVVVFARLVAGRSPAGVVQRLTR
jgi:Sortase domain